MKTEAGPETAPVDEREDLPLARAVRYCLLVFLVLRLLTFVVGLASVMIVPPLGPAGVPGWPANPTPDPGWHNLFTAWERFDALWFLRIADAGYGLGDGSAAFFPLYPLAIRSVSLLLLGHPFAASFLVSNGAFVGALVMTYLLTAMEFDERRARTTVVLISFFPTSYFFLMPYSESLFLLCAVTAFWGARRGRWVLAGAAGAAAALTRSVGLVLVPALAIEAFHRRAEGRGRAWPGLLAAGATGLGTLAYLGWWQLRAGEWLAPITEQRNWQREFWWPWTTLWRATKIAFSGGHIGDVDGAYWLIDWLIVIPVLLLAVYAAGRFRPSYAVFLWGGLLLPLSFVFWGRPLISMPRFVLTLFPVFWAAAELADGFHVPRWALAAVGAVGIGVLSVLTVNWYYIF
ncbi:MAG: mannosyltransferase family protein [Actinomycetota bacterium]